ncbi:uroporphyrinogen-III synthase [Siccirubricoccus deserti]
MAAATLDPAAGPLLLAVGAGYGQELARALRVLGFRVTRRIAYAAKPAATLPEAARLALDQGEVVAALFFSPRSASCAISCSARLGWPQLPHRWWRWRSAPGLPKRRSRRSHP